MVFDSSNGAMDITIKAVSDAYELYYIVKCDKDREFYDDENQS